MALAYLPDWENQVRWLTFKNDSGEDIPAFAIMEVVEVLEDGTPVCGKPTQNSAKLTMINGDARVPTDGYGRGTRETPMWVQYETDDGVPATDEQWGTESDSWKLAKKPGLTRGFLTVAMRESNEPPAPGVVYVDREECLP